MDKGLYKGGNMEDAKAQIRQGTLFTVNCVYWDIANYSKLSLKLFYTLSRIRSRLLREIWKSSLGTTILRRTDIAALIFSWPSWYDFCEAVELRQSMIECLCSQKHLEG
jgi:hypothetical protein